MTLLKDIAQIEKGRKYNLLEENQEGAIRVFQANDFRNENKPLYTLDDDGVLAQEDDIMMVWDGSVGQMGFGRSGYVGSTMVKLKVKNKKQFSPFFIYRFLQTKSEYLKRKATGATIMHINRKSLEQLIIPELDLSDQLHIANLLSKAENLISQRKESIRLLDDFLKSTFLEMFGDIQKMKEMKSENFSDHIEFLTSGSRGWAKYYSNTGAKFLRIQNVWKGALRIDELQYVNAPKTQEAIRTKVQEGDLLITITADLGRTAVVPKNFGEAYINQHIALVRLKKSVNPTYAAFYFFMPFGYSAIQKKNKSAVKSGLTFNDIKTLPIIVPPIKLQIQFAQIVEKTEALKIQYKQSLQELENLYGSLSQRAFRGELSIKDESLLMAAEPETKYGE
ncbi:MAG: hypothetical protein A2W91_05470 [Bacteroidetes bacterium GWF2_38_335]|nr:MAG: hypothetical protein A2W91_05470 [Bacteroidetes bacterium GWF2_38_335]HBS88107.1 hypothetical protein [Bacteroidales bacterium]